MCYGRKRGFNHDHRTCPVHKADTEAYKKAHGSKKRAPAGIREAKVEVDRDELSKLVSQGHLFLRGPDRVGQGDPGDQEELGPQVGQQEQGEQPE